LGTCADALEDIAQSLNGHDQKQDVHAGSMESRNLKAQRNQLGRGFRGARAFEWVNFHAMRRTHSCLLKQLDVGPQIRAEQMGHTVDVNENIYTRTSLGRRREAVNKLESALRIM